MLVYDVSQAFPIVMLLRRLRPRSDWRSWWWRQLSSILRCGRHYLLPLLLHVCHDEVEMHLSRTATKKHDDPLSPAITWPYCFYDERPDTSSLQGQAPASHHTFGITCSGKPFKTSMITATTTTTPPPRGPRTTKTIQHNRKQHRATRKGACGAYVISRCLKANVIHLTSL